MIQFVLRIFLGKNRSDKIFLPSLPKERIDASKKVISQLQKERKELTQKIRLEQLLQKQRREKQHSK